MHAEFTTRQDASCVMAPSYVRRIWIWTGRPDRRARRPQYASDSTRVSSIPARRLPSRFVQSRCDLQAAAIQPLRSGVGGLTRRRTCCTHHRPRRPADVDESGSEEWWRAHRFPQRDPVLVARVPVPHRPIDTGGTANNTVCGRVPPTRPRYSSEDVRRRRTPLAQPAYPSARSFSDTRLRRAQAVPYKTPHPASRPFPRFLTRTRSPLSPRPPPAFAASHPPSSSS